jgi:hypothetical protein
MAVTKRHTSLLDNRLKEQIDDILAKLKAPRTHRHIQNWLENFELSEVELALNFLLFFDYITFEDLQSRLEPFIKQIAALSEDAFVLFVPYGKYVKSNDLVMYCVNKSETFIRYSNKKKFSYTRDILELALDQWTIIVFVDDFIGTGKSFIKWYKRRLFQSWLKKNRGNIANQYILCAEVMNDGKSNLNSAYPTIQVLGNSKTKIFDAKTSPFRALNNVGEMEGLALKYGALIPVGFSFPNTVYTPRGYDESEALLAFDFGTPNNTIPIIWGSKGWTPIFPRVGKQRILMLQQAKKDASQFQGIIKKYGYTISSDLKIITGSRTVSFNSQEDLGLFTFLILKKQGYSDPEISQTIGVQIQILNSIIKIGHRKKLVDNNNNLTSIGEEFLKEIAKQTHKFRENDDLSNKLTEVFVPSVFIDTT